MPHLIHLKITGPAEWIVDFTLALAHSRHLEYALPCLQLTSIFSFPLPQISDISNSRKPYSTQALRRIARGVSLSKTVCFYFRFVVPTLEALGLHLDMVEQRFETSSPDFPTLRLPSHCYFLSDQGPMRPLQDMLDRGLHIWL